MRNSEEQNMSSMKSGDQEDQPQAKKRPRVAVVKINDYDDGDPGVDGGGSSGRESVVDMFPETPENAVALYYQNIKKKQQKQENRPNFDCDVIPTAPRQEEEKMDMNQVGAEREGGFLREDDPAAMMVEPQLNNPIHFEEGFAFSMWKLTENGRIIKEAFELLPSRGGRDALRGMILGEKGSTCFCQRDDILEFFGKNVIPIAIVGEFLLAVFLLHSLRNLPTTVDLLYLYKKKEAMHPRFSAILQKYTIYHLQQTVRKMKELDDDVPQELIEQLVYKNEFVVMNEELNEDVGVEFKAENDILEQLLQWLLQLVSSTAFQTGIQLVDVTCTQQEKVETWNFLSVELIGLVRKQKKMPLLNVLIKNDLKRETHPVACMVSDGIGTLMPLKLHAEVVKASGGIILHSPTFVMPGTRKDISTLRNLLYWNSNLPLERYKGSITFNLYCMAQRLNVVNVGKLVFNGNNVTDYMTDENKVDILKIVIMEEMEEHVKHFARNIATIFAEDEIVTCLIGITDETSVATFLGRDDLYLDEALVYKMMIAWACSAAKIPCHSNSDAILNIKAERESLAKFLLVRNSLRLALIAPLALRIARQGFITIEDFALASKIHMMKNKKSVPSDEQVWFSTKPHRQQQE